MRKRTPTRQAPRSRDVLANGTWLDELPETHPVVDLPLIKLVDRPDLELIEVDE